MELEGIIKEFVKGSEQYVILPKGVKIINKVLKLLDGYIVREIGFEEFYVPKIIPEETLRKAGIIDKWNNYLISVVPFGETKGVTERYAMDLLQCLALYQAFKNEVIDIPLKVYDHSGPTYRNEDLDKIVPGIKQREFHRAEFVYMGSPEQVIETKNRCLTQLEKLCIDIGLEHQREPGDSCYDGPEIEVTDIEVFVPGFKNKKGKPFMELAGISNKFDFQINNFNIKEKDGKKLWSGCMGIGLDRFMTAVYKNGINL